MKRFLPFFFFVFATIGQTEAAWDAGSFLQCHQPQTGSDYQKLLRPAGARSFQIQGGNKRNTQQEPAR